MHFTLFGGKQGFCQRYKFIQSTGPCPCAHAVITNLARTKLTQNQSTFCESDVKEIHFFSKSKQRLGSLTLYFEKYS